MTPAHHVDWRRLRGRSTAVSMICLAVAAIGTSAGTVVAGRLAEHPSQLLVAVLAACVLGASVIETTGKVLWVSASDRMEGALRDDLVDVVLRQPLTALAEQAVGEILDRIDDDTHEVGNLVRWQIWMFARTAFASIPLWLVAGFTWWPAWVLFPVLGGLTFVLVRPLLGEISRRKVIEEASWTDHAAALEEGIAGRDDLRTNLGQAHVIQRVASLSAIVHARFADVVRIESQVVRRAGIVLFGLLAGVGIAGVQFASRDAISVAELVTLFLVTSAFVGQVAMVANHLPDLQAGLGAVMRLRQMMAVPTEPVGGAATLSTGTSSTASTVEIRDLTFSYAADGFALRGVSLTVPAGQTMALVGRSGSGKSTLASLLSRAIDPPAGTVMLGGVDVCDLDLDELRSAVGVVTQRTEILAGTLAENVTLFGSQPRADIEAALDRLGLTSWVAGLPDGLDTLLGPGGTKLSAGEEQLVAFARLLLRDVRVVVLDEATARMDPHTERRVIAAAEHLLEGRTGILIAHRLSTIRRAGLVAVLDRGAVIQSGARSELAVVAGPFRDLLEAGREDSAPEPEAAADSDQADDVGSARRTGPRPPAVEVGTGPSLARGIFHAIRVKPFWGVAGALGFTVATLTGANGALPALAWGRIVEALGDGRTPWSLVAVYVGLVIASPLVLSDAFWRFPRWWVEVLLRARMAVLRGQTDQRRLPRTPPGEVVARAMDADRFVRYGDRWMDFVTGLIIAATTALLAGTWMAGAVLLTVLATSAAASTFGRRLAGRSAAASSSARARFGRAVVSTMESARTIKLAAASTQVRAHLRAVDAGRVDAAVREHRIQAVLEGVPMLMVQGGVVTAWAVFFGGGWGLGTTLLVANAVAGYDWFGRVAGMVVTEAPGTRAWQIETTKFAGGGDLMDLPIGVDLVAGLAPEPSPVSRVPLAEIGVHQLAAIHDDGTIGVQHVDLTVNAGELVLLVGQVGSGKSSLMSALAGLIDHTGQITWNGSPVTDPQVFLRPGQVAHVAQVPRVLSGTFADNVRLGHEREFTEPVSAARLGQDVREAGGRDAMVGHRGVRLSGGQVQRLALARALAADAELLLADDVSSALDATTEVDLWAALRARGTTVIGATSKRAALAQADRVVVLVDGEIAATGPWTDLADDWGHLAG